CGARPRARTRRTGASAPAWPARRPAPPRAVRGPTRGRRSCVVPALGHPPELLGQTGPTRVDPPFRAAGDAVRFRGVRVDALVATVVRARRRHGEIQPERVDERGLE